MLQKIMFTSILAACLVGHIQAQILRVEDEPNARVSNQSTVTYFDLVRKVFPDAHFKKEGSDYLLATVSKKGRNLFDERKTNFPETMLPEVELEVAQKLETKSGKDKFLWLIIKVTGTSGKDPHLNFEDSILAAYRLADSSAELVDVAFVRTNDHAWLADQDDLVSPVGKVTIAPRQEAVIVYNWTQVSLGETTFSLVDVGENGFRVILNQFSLAYDTRCGSNFVESARVRPAKDSVGGYRNLEVTVTLERSNEKENGDGVDLMWRKYFRYVFAWQPAKGHYGAVINHDKQRAVRARKHSSCGDQ